MPAPSARQSRSRFSRSRIGGAHLHSVAAVRNRLGIEDQVVRTGFGADRHALGARAAASGSTRIGRREMDDVDPAAVLAREPRSAARSPRSPRPAAARRARSHGDAEAPRRRGRLDGSAARRAPAAATRARRGSAAPRAGRLRVAAGNSSMPESIEKGLEAPGTPAVEHRRSSAALPGHDAAPERHVHVALAPRRGALGLEGRQRCVVTGVLLSGMSTSVVIPPAAAARVAVANPSHSVRPGSLTWTWLSTSPGITTSAPKSSRRRWREQPREPAALRSGRA